jgi:Pro-kumamolisin, activation domain/ell wall binding domain 2 (CWB2)
MGSPHSPGNRISGSARRRTLRIGVPIVTTMAVVAAGLGQGAQAATATVSAAPAAVGTVSPAPAGAKAAAAPAASTEVDGEVLLNVRDQAALSAYATAVSNPQSAYYKEYLSPAQIQADFAPTSDEVDAVDAALRAAGLTPGTALGDNLAIPFTASLGQLHHAFDVDFAGYRLADGRAAFGATSAPKISATVAPYVDGVLGLSNFDLPHTNTKSIGHPVSAPYSSAGASATNASTAGSNATGSSAAGASAASSSASGSTSYSAPAMCSSLSSAIADFLQTQENGVPDVDGEWYYSPSAMAKAYGTDSQLAAGNEGQGVTVAVLEWEAVSTQALADYKSCYKLNNPVSFVKVDGGPKTAPTATNGVGGEASLDIEDIASLAPGTSIIDYEGTDTTTDFTDADWLDPITEAVTDDRAKVISLSWGECEAQTDTTMRDGEYTDFELSAIEGQSVFVAAGDDGSTDCETPSGDPIDQIAVDDPQNSPFVTSMGGDYMQGITDPSVSVWNDSTYDVNGETGTGGGAGGGGVATDFSLSGADDFQAGFTGAGYTNACDAEAGSVCRQDPDLSTLSDWRSGFPQIGYASGSSMQVFTDGGTSWSAPTMSAITALADASPGCRANGSVGFEDPRLYQLASNPASYANDFSDITSGNNDYTTSGYTGGLYTSTKGYDLASGLGSPKASTLIPALCTAVGRVQAGDPVGDAVAVSQSVFRNNGSSTAGLTQAKAAVLATSANFSDSLLGSELAAVKHGPLLLTPAASLATATRAEIKRVLPKGATVYVLGTTWSVSAEVAHTLTSLGYRVDRLAGSDQYATAAIVDETINPHPTDVLVADGTGFEDALSASDAAGATPGSVVVLSDGASLPAASIAYLNSVKGSVKTAEGVGAHGYAAITSGLRSGAVHWTGVTPRAFVGSAAPQDAIWVAGSYYSLPTKAFLAGQNPSAWPIAAAGAAAGGVIGAPLLWTPTGTLDSDDAEFLGMEHTSGRLEQVLVLGGTDTVSNGVEGALRSALS